jgi:IclR family transcriptional regulator, acetate operon repressor
MTRSQVTASTTAGRADATVLAVVRTADVLTYLARSPSRLVGVTEIAGAVGTSKAVVFRILTSLLDRGYVGYDEGTRRYFLGPQSLLLGLAAVERHDMRSLAHELLAEMSAATSETTTLSIRSGWERIYIDQVTPDRDIKMVVPIGRPFPLHAGSSSKAFLAFLPPAEQDRYFLEVRSRERLTPRTAVDESALRAEVALIRSRGFASSRGERQADAASVAAPVLDGGGGPAAVISVCGPIERFDLCAEHAVTLLLEATRLLSRQLAYTG